MEFKEGDLVCLRMETGFGKSDTWWRVMFIDNDGTFVGKLERHHWYEYQTHKKGDIDAWNCQDVQHVYKEGEKFCYGDNISICECPGLCRDK